jgi:hypothetical protein
MASLRSVLPITILLSIRHISLHSCQSSWPDSNPALLSRRPHISTIIFCVGSCSIPAECSFSRRSVQLWTPNQKSARRKYQNGNCRTRLAIRRLGLQRTCSAPSGFRCCPIEHCPSVPYDCNPRFYNVFERSLGGLLKLASQDSNRSLGRLCLYAVRGASRCPIPSKLPVSPGASLGASQ